MKIPFNEAAILQAIDKEENAKLSWIEKKFNYRPYSILPTATIAGKYKKPLDTQGQDVVFKPFKFKYIFFILAAVAVAGVFVPFALIPGHTWQAGLLINAAVLFGIIAVAGIFIDIKRNFQITLSSKEININNTSYKWSEINKLYILSRQQGKNTIYFLILALDTGEIKKINCTSILTGFGGRRKKLSAYIEYYKSIA